MADRPIIRLQLPGDTVEEFQRAATLQLGREFFVELDTPAVELVRIEAPFKSGAIAVRAEATAKAASREGRSGALIRLTRLEPNSYGVPIPPGSAWPEAADATEVRRKPDAPVIARTTTPVAKPAVARTATPHVVRRPAVIEMVVDDPSSEFQSAPITKNSPVSADLAKQLQEAPLRPTPPPPTPKTPAIIRRQTPVAGVPSIPKPVEKKVPPSVPPVDVDEEWGFDAPTLGPAVKAVVAPAPVPAKKPPPTPPKGVPAVNKALDDDAAFDDAFGMLEDDPGEPPAPVARSADEITKPVSAPELVAQPAARPTPPSPIARTDEITKPVANPTAPPRAKSEPPVRAKSEPPIPRLAGAGVPEAKLLSSEPAGERPKTQRVPTDPAIPKRAPSEPSIERPKTQRVPTDPAIPRRAPSEPSIERPATEAELAAGDGTSTLRASTPPLGAPSDAKLDATPPLGVPTDPKRMTQRIPTDAELRSEKRIPTPPLGVPTDPKRMTQRVPTDAELRSEKRIPTPPLGVPPDPKRMTQRIPTDAELRSEKRIPTPPSGVPTAGKRLPTPPFGVADGKRIPPSGTDGARIPTPPRGTQLPAEVKPKTHVPTDPVIESPSSEPSLLNEPSKPATNDGELAIAVVTESKPTAPAAKPRFSTNPGELDQDEIPTFDPSKPTKPVRRSEPIAVVPDFAEAPKADEITRPMPPSELAELAKPQPDMAPVPRPSSEGVLATPRASALAMTNEIDAIEQATSTGAIGSMRATSETLRPKSKLPLILAALAVIAAAIVVVVLATRGGSSTDPKPTPKPSATKTEVDKHLREAASRISDGKLVGPDGDAALDHLLAAKSLAPDDKQVLAQLQALAATFEKLGDGALASNDLAEAATHYQAALTAEPDRASAKAKLADVENRARGK